jgi:hypothetical protein
LAVAALPVSQGAAKPPSTFNPVVEAQNFSITQQDQTIYDTPQYQEQLAVDSATSTARATSAEANDPERFFTDDLCWNLSNGCAGDIRLNDWGPNGYGIVRPILFTARDGATISGHVWATVAGPAKRPGIVITNGSVQADENMYWYAAQALAKDGYVVLTFDPQGQGQSDTFGESPTRARASPRRPTGGPSTTAPRTRSTSCCRRRSTRTSRCRAAAAGPATRPSRTGEPRRASTPATTRSGSY